MGSDKRGSVGLGCGMWGVGDVGMCERGKVG